MQYVRAISSRGCKLHGILITHLPYDVVLCHAEVKLIYPEVVIHFSQDPGFFGKEGNSWNGVTPFHDQFHDVVNGRVGFGSSAEVLAQSPCIPFGAGVFDEKSTWNDAD